MTREEWHWLLGEWCERLQIDKTPRLEFVPPRRMPQRVAMLTEYFLAIEEGWLIKISTAPMPKHMSMNTSDATLRIVRAFQRRL